MPRLKEIRIPAKETAIYDIIVAEMKKNPVIATEYDIEAAGIYIPKKKAPPYIKEVDKVISNIRHYYAANKRIIEIINKKQLIFKKDLPKIMKVSRPTVAKWLKDGFIKPSRIPGTPFDCFQIDELIAQLQKQKQ